jgi:hypothetical protein
MLIRIRSFFAAHRPTHLDAVAPRPVAADTTRDTYEVRHQTPSTPTGVETHHNLQALTSTLQTVLQTIYALVGRIRSFFATPRATRPGSGAPGPVATDAIGGTHGTLRQRPSHPTTAAESPHMLQAPTGTPRSASRAVSGPDSALPVQSYPQPVLTRASLKAWQECRGLTDAEYKERDIVATAILAFAVPSVKGSSDAGSLKVVGNLNFSCLRHLTQLPAGLNLSGGLNCSHCTRLTQLPDGLRVGGHLNCSYTGLIDLPKGLSIGGNLYCVGCVDLTQVGARLSVGGSLYFDNCTGLTQLGAGMSVGGNLVCSDCTSLTHVPEVMSLGGNLYCEGCTNLTSLPNDIANWGRRTTDGDVRHIALSGSGITRNLLQRLQETQTPGMRFSFSMAVTTTDHSFADLDAAGVFWQQQAPGRTVPNMMAWQELLPTDCNFLRQFLGRLCDTADYQHQGARVRLAGRVCDLLQAMDESPALRRLCSDRISDALQTCNDRVIWTMNQLEIAVRVHQAQRYQDGASLKELLLSFMRLDIVQDHARQKVNSLTWVDEIEVFLAYESGLREALKLPVSAEHMLHAICAKVTQADLDKARDAAEAAANDPDKVTAYLQDSPTWQHYLRRQEAKQWAWERMVPEPWPQGLQADELQCAITLENYALLAHPVLAPSGSTWRAYEAENLLTHWIEHGTDAFYQKLKLRDLRRPAMPIGD